MKALFRYKYEALQAAQSAAGYTYESTADAEDLDAQDPKLNDATGEVNCLRSADGDIFAWWEESPIIYIGVGEPGCCNSDPTLDRSKLAREYCDDEIIEVTDADPAYLDLIKYLD